MHYLLRFNFPRIRSIDPAGCIATIGMRHGAPVGLNVGEPNPIVDH